MLVKKTPAISLNVGLLSSKEAEEPQRRTARHSYIWRILVTPLPRPPASGLTQKPHRAERFPARAKRSDLTLSGRASKAPHKKLPLLTTRVVPLPAAPDKSREEA